MMVSNFFAKTRRKNRSFVNLVTLRCFVSCLPLKIVRGKHSDPRRVVKVVPSSAGLRICHVSSRWLSVLLKLRWEEELLDESSGGGGGKKRKPRGKQGEKKRIKIWRKGNASVKLQWADRWSRYNVFLRACVERERKRIISYRACQRDWWRRFVQSIFHAFVRFCRALF